MVLRFRHRLLSVVVLGVVTSGLSLAALFRILSVTSSYRIERGRHEVADELASLATASPSLRAARVRQPASWLIGLRGGFAAGPEDVAQIPAALAARVGPVLARAALAQAPTTAEQEQDEGVFVTAARPAEGGGFAWADFVVRPPPYLASWRKIVVALAIATFILVTSATYSMVAMKRSAQVLNQSLAALGDDLTASLPRPSIRELGEVADGIGRLATRLADARRTEERLAADLSRQERLAALGRVVAGVAHEVRNPLASIKLRLDLAAAQNPDLPASVTQALGHATKEISRLDRLVADLLTVAGKPLGVLTPLPLGELARSRANAVAPWAESRGVTVRTVGEATADADADSLGRAIDNLLRNAVESSPPGGTVEIQVEARGAAGAQIRVEDRGTGVAPEHVPQLFEPFFTTKADGTGLGLAICRAVVRAHGGEITYDRQSAMTRFIIDLPRARRADTGPELPRRELGAGLPA